MTTARTRSKTSQPSNGATTGYESELWRMADAEYKHIVLGLIFLKYISDAFEEAHAKLVLEIDEGANPESPDEYRAQNIFWVPAGARWSQIMANARQSDIGRLIDDAMTAIESDNPALKDVLPKNYGNLALDRDRLGQLIDLIATFRWATPRRAQETCWAECTSTSSHGSPAPRARTAANSTPRAASSRCW